MALPSEIQEIQERVVGMYSEVPWPTNREADEEMGWRLKCLGVLPEDYQGKRVVELGSGTGEYALWYAANGAGEVVGVDLSDGSLALARQRQQEAGLDNIEFRKADILDCPLPDDYFDYAYSVGVLHHTGDAFRGFEHLVRITKPGGIVIVSLYSAYSRRMLRNKQLICRMLGGDDLDKRVKWGERLFSGTLRKLNKRYHELNTKQVAYDVFGFPHETVHTATEVLRWFDRTGVEYKGSFAPLRVRDYFYAFSQPEYQTFRRTFDGFPGLRLVSDGMVKLSKAVRRDDGVVRAFGRPSRLSCIACQSAWLPFGLRFGCFTLAGIKQG